MIRNKFSQTRFTKIRVRVDSIESARGREMPTQQSNSCEISKFLDRLLENFVGKKFNKISYKNTRTTKLLYPKIFRAKTQSLLYLVELLEIFHDMREYDPAAVTNNTVKKNFKNANIL